MWFVLTESTISGLWRSNDLRPSPNLSPRLRDKIWDWPGNEATVHMYTSRSQDGRSQRRRPLSFLTVTPGGTQLPVYPMQSDKERELLTTPGYNKAIQHHHVMQTFVLRSKRTAVCLNVLHQEWCHCDYNQWKVLIGSRSHMSMFQQCIVRGWS